MTNPNEEVRRTSAYQAGLAPVETMFLAKNKNLKAVFRSGVLCAALLLAVPAPAADQQNDRAFNAFYSTFQDAVALRDEAALRKLMAPDFSFIRGTNVNWDRVFQGLAEDQGRQWANLQQAVQGQPAILQGKNQEPLTRVLRCTPTDVIYNCLVVFTQDRQARWRWQGMIMPTR